MLTQRILFSLLTEILIHPFELAIFLSQIEVSWLKDNNPGSQLISQKSLLQYLSEIYRTRNFLGLYHGLQFNVLKILVAEFITTGLWKLFSGK